MKRSYSFGSQVAWLSILPMIVLAAVLETFYLHERFTELDAELGLRASLIARQLAAASEYGLFSNNTEFLNDLANKTLQEPGVSSLLIMNQQEQLLVDVRRAGLDENKFRHFSTHLSTNTPDAELLQGYLLASQPVYASSIALDESASTAQIPIGRVGVLVSRRSVESKKLALFQASGVLTLAIIVATYLVFVIFSRRVTRPIVALSDAIHRIGSGNLSEKVELSTNIRELRILSQGIDQMSSDLLEERSRLEEKIKQATRRLEELAYHDTVTMLPNRRLFMERLSYALAARKRDLAFGAIIFIDLDNFKPINDLYGHEAGDRLLTEVGNRIKRCVREVDVVARFGGDEYAVLVTDLATEEARSRQLACMVAEKIRGALDAPYLFDIEKAGQPSVHIEHRCSASIGVTLFSGQDVELEGVIMRADQAMYRAKANGKNLVVEHE